MKDFERISNFLACSAIEVFALALVCRQCEVPHGGIKWGVIWFTALSFGRCVWFDDLEDLGDARAILERLGQVNRPNRPHTRELGDALGDRQDSCDLLGGELKLPYPRGEQALADRVQIIRWLWAAARLRRLSDQLLVGLATPAAPVSPALFSTGQRGLDDEISLECGLKGWSLAPGQDRFRGTLADRIRIAGASTHAWCRHIGREPIAAGDPPEGQRVWQARTHADEGDRVIASQRNRHGAAQMRLTGDVVEPADRRRQDRAAGGARLLTDRRWCDWRCGRSACLSLAHSSSLAFHSRSAHATAIRSIKSSICSARRSSPPSHQNGSAWR